MLSKKSAYGVDFVILGIENQAKDPLCKCHFDICLEMLSYLKEYNEIAKNIKMKKPHDSDEFLSKMKKTDRLHSVLTIYLYLLW